MVCRIHRNLDTDNVEKVTNSNGGESTLFNDALKITKDEDKALNIWAYAFTPTFTNNYGNWIAGNYNKSLKDGEPKIEDVLESMQLDTTDEKLSLKDVSDVLDFISVTGDSVVSLFSRLKQTLFNKNGEFTLNRDRLEKSGLFNSDEITNLMTYPSYRGNLIRGMSRLRNSLMEDSEIFAEYENNTEDEGDLHVLSGEVSIFGKEKVLPTEEVNSYVVSNIPEYVNEETFIGNLNSLDNETIRDAIINSPEAIDYFRDLVKTSKMVPILVLRNGELVEKDSTGLMETLKNTISVNISKLDFTKAIDSLRGIPDEFWGLNNPFVNEAINNVIKESARYGIDIIGLKDEFKNKSKEEIIGFLDYIDDFNVTTESLNTTERDIEELASEINSFFNITELPKSDIINVPQELRGRDLYKVEDNLNELDIFQNTGLINLFGNIYQKVNTDESYTEAINNVYASILSDVTILPKEAYSGVPSKKGLNYNTEFIVNPENENIVKQSIDSYLTKRVNIINTKNSITLFNTAKQVELYKTLFNSNIDSSIQNTESDFASRLASFSGDYNYLTTDFISDFYLRTLDEKLNNSALWNEALKYFTFNNNGIDIDNRYDIGKIKTILQSEPLLFYNLSNYSLISKNDNLSAFREVNKDLIIDTIENRRNYVSQNPMVISKFNKEYTRVSDVTIIVPKVNEEFIRLSDGVYENTSTENGISQFSKLEINESPNYIRLSTKEPTVESISLSNYILEEVAGPNKILNNNKLSKITDRVSCSF